jgi:hypothetical protein
MAITRAQQARQLYRFGGDTMGGPNDKSTSSPGPDDRSSAQQTSNNNAQTGGGGRQDGNQEDSRIFYGPKGETIDIGFQGDLNKREQEFQNFLDRKNKVNLFGLSKILTGPAQKFSNFNASVNRPFFGDVIRAGKFNYTTKDGKPLSFDMTEDELEDAYQNYMSSRLGGEIDAYGNPLNTGNDGGDPIIPFMAQAPSNMDQEPEVEEEPFQRNFRLMADGGRAEFAEGGIMPRLSDLSGNVSSAEQMLQEINQRLQSAESTLGEGGGGGMGSLPNNQFNVTLPETLKPALQPNMTEQVRQLPIGQPTANNVAQGRESFFGQPLFDKDGFRLGDQRYGTGLVDGPSMALPGSGLTNQTPGGPMQSPLQTALGLADGGRAALAEGGMPYEGGIMDLESSRQMYGLGKLVKKVTRSVKKIAKSPIGKAALLYFGGNALAGGGLKSFLLGSNAGPNFSKTGLLQKMFLKNPSTGFSLGNLSGTAVAGIPAALSYFMTPEEKEQQAMNYGADIDDPRFIMANNRDFTNTRLLAEGGSTEEKEPVAKKTMPLLDMDGQEMDLRAEGGFVPIGRMEKADDVPARLSKNEFVFTAEAVRNAGEGDVDKGAEVMYNMMKNLESGGEVSEESQGLEGAREMFQTSQRLEEVI